MEFSVLYNGADEETVRKVVAEAAAFYDGKVVFNGFESAELASEYYLEHITHKYKDPYLAEGLLFTLQANQFLVVNSRLIDRKASCGYHMMFLPISGIADHEKRSVVITLLAKENPCSLARHEINHVIGLKHCGEGNCLMHDGFSEPRDSLCGKCESELERGLAKL